MMWHCCSNKRFVTISEHFIVLLDQQLLYYVKTVTIRDFATISDCHNTRLSLQCHCIAMPQPRTHHDDRGNFREWGAIWHHGIRSLGLCVRQDINFVSHRQLFLVRSVRFGAGHFLCLTEKWSNFTRFYMFCDCSVFCFFLFWASIFPLRGDI